MPRPPSSIPAPRRYGRCSSDAVVTGRADFRAVIDGIAAEAETLIMALRQRPKGAVDLQAAPPSQAADKKRSAREPRGSAKAASKAKAAGKPAPAKPRTRKAMAPKASRPRDDPVPLGTA